MSKQRNVGVDITRIVAFLSVIAVHFFLNSGFYNTAVLGKRMFLMVLVRTFCMICVPLFMLLTGYLHAGRDIPIDKVSLKAHAWKLKNIVLTYLVSALFVFLFRKWHLGKDLDILKDGVFIVLGYSNYAWYVNMYIGMFLLIPFLNVVWRGITHKEGRQCLLLILLILTLAPSVFNIYDFTTPGALQKPWTSTEYTQIVPNWWDEMYPITYFYIGAYLKKDVDIKKYKTIRLMLLLAIIVMVFGVYNIWRCYSVKFIKGLWCHGWGSLQNTAMSVLVFMIINSIDYPQWITNSKLIPRIAALTFGGYLLSWIPDKALYPILKSNIASMPLRFNYFPVMFALVVVISLLLSFVVEQVVLCSEVVYNYLSHLWRNRNAA